MKTAALIMMAMLGAPAALACQIRYSDAPPERFYDLADVVFTAHLTKAEEITLPANKQHGALTAIEGQVKIIEVLKGTPPASSKVHDLVQNNFDICSSLLLPGNDYLFFLKPAQDKSASAAEWNYVGLPTGSRLIFPADSNITQEMLRKLRAYAQNQPAKQ